MKSTKLAGVIVALINLTVLGSILPCYGFDRPEDEQKRTDASVPDSDNLSHESFLPPEIPWQGESLALMVAKDDPWITPSERTDLSSTPRYAETVRWLERLGGAAPELSLISIGKSYEGRDIWMVYASNEGAADPDSRRGSGKPLLLAHAGIHSGEIDGKDAGLMLLRDLTVRGTKRSLLDKADFLFIPILSVDGHERFSKYSRINQRGPTEMGWRTNARNQNLNRDFTKLDTPEVRALVAVINAWEPDLYLDLHVTDGIDYQYDITWGSTGAVGHSPSAAAWLGEVLKPALTRSLKEMGHIPGPLIFPKNYVHTNDGISDFMAKPRFSNGYGDARHLPTILVENHSLKPYKQRVLGTYVLLESTLRTLGERGAGLRLAVAEDKARRPRTVTLEWEESDEILTMSFLGIESEGSSSDVTGTTWISWTGKPAEFEVKRIQGNRPKVRVERPEAYWIPPAWPEVIERLAAHGIVMETIKEPREIEVEMYRLEDVVLERNPYEGHVRVKANPKPESRRTVFPPGSVRVSTDQPLGELAVHLLEPEGPDSFFQWGFFLEPLQQTEYVEWYVMVPMAERMMERDPDLAREFQRALEEDSDLRKDPRRRVQWFYRHTPYFDSSWRLYPVGREL